MGTNRVEGRILDISNIPHDDLMAWTFWMVVIIAAIMAINCIFLFMVLRKQNPKKQKIITEEEQAKIMMRRAERGDKEATAWLMKHGYKEVI